MANVYVTDKRGFTASFIVDELKVTLGHLHLRIGRKLVHISDISVIPAGRPDYPVNLYVKQEGDLGVYHFEEFDPWKHDIPKNPRKYLRTA